jgi:hypothetical protein
VAKARAKTKLRLPIPRQHGQNRASVCEVNATLFMQGLFGASAANEFIVRLVSGHCHMSFHEPVGSMHNVADGTVDVPWTVEQRRFDRSSASSQPAGAS